jgi:hypothetical protein
MQTFYEKMNFPQQQLERMKQLNIPWEHAMGWWSGFWAVVVLVYLLYIRKYFTGASSEPSARH